MDGIRNYDAMSMPSPALTNGPLPQGLDPDLLRSFVLIAEEGSFSRAGERVGRTQSAVSMQMQRLEAMPWLAPVWAACVALPLSVLISNSQPIFGR